MSRRPWLFWTALAALWLLATAADRACETLLECARRLVADTIGAQLQMSFGGRPLGVRQQ